MIYLQQNTPLPPFLPYPRFLQRLPLNETERLIYILLLDRARLSQSNGWVDEEGRVYVYYTITDLARDSGKSSRTVRYALTGLEKQDLLLRRRQGRCCANRLYLRLPPAESCPGEGKKPASRTGRKLPPNKNNRIIPMERTYDYAEGESL